MKELREAKGMVQRQVAAELEVDTAYISKIESNEKPLSRTHLKKISALFGISEKKLRILWVADKIINVIQKEDVGEQAIDKVQEHLKKTNS